MFEPKKSFVQIFIKAFRTSSFAGDNSAAIGQRIILPSSLTIGPCHMVQNYQNVVAIYRWARWPNVFVTFTCNPQWPEIKRALLLGLQP